MARRMHDGRTLRQVSDSNKVVMRCIWCGAERLFWYGERGAIHYSKWKKGQRFSSRCRAEWAQEERQRVKELVPVKKDAGKISALFGKKEEKRLDTRKPGGYDNDNGN